MFWIQYCFIIYSYDGVNISHTAVANFDSVLVKDFYKICGLWENAIICLKFAEYGGFFGSPLDFLMLLVTQMIH